MRKSDRIAKWIAWHLPRRVCMFVLERMVGLYEDMSKLTALEVIERWDAGWPND